VNSPLVFPAHQLSHYRASAALLDRSDNQRVAAALGALDEGSKRAVTVESTFYQATRVDPGGQR
jgi:hypothetical protein